MNSTIWENEDLEVLNDLRQKETLEANCAGECEPKAGGRLNALKQLTLQLFRELQLVNDVERQNLEGGVDYYEEVRRFEVDLIKRALIQTGGHQKRAARLLNLKPSTLNSKIKLFDIQVEEFTAGYPIAATVEVEARPHA